MIWLKDNGQGGYDFSRYEIAEKEWFPVKEDDERIALVGHREPTYIEKRQAKMEDGGYGTWQEQLEMMNEQGVEAWKDHCEKVKATYPKE